MLYRVEFTSCKQMNRSWMSKDRRSKDYGDIVENFIRPAIQNATNQMLLSMIRKPNIPYTSKDLKNIYSFMVLIKVTILGISMGKQLVVVNH